VTITAFWGEKMMSFRKLALNMPPEAKRYFRRMAAQFLEKGFDIPHPWFDLIREAQRVRPDVLLDIGAHIGEMAIEMARALPQTSVHAFEPTPSSYKTLKTRLKAYPNAHAHAIALGAENGSSSFFLNVNEQTNSLLDNDEMNKRFVPEATSHEQKIDVIVRRLDDWLDEHIPHGQIMMKVDVQGAEMLLIRGGERAFRERVQAILTEVEYIPLYENSASFFELSKVLQNEFNFVIGQIYPTQRLGHRAGWGDILFIRRDLHE
jgi:FkbM family methyltransferase